MKKKRSTSRRTKIEMQFTKKKFRRAIKPRGRSQSCGAMRSTCFTFLAGFSTVVFVSLGIGDRLDRVSYERKLLALHKVLEFVHNRTHQMNVDAAFGVTLVEANLAGALLGGYTKNLTPAYKVALQQLFDYAIATRRKLLRAVLPENEKIALLSRILNNPTLWIEEIPWSLGRLGPVPAPSAPLTTAANLIREGRPQEDESDDCIFQIVRGALQRNCRISHDCLSPVDKRHPARGYPLTHRLLYAQTAVALGCLDRGEAVLLITPRYCAAILQDLVDLEAAGFPDVSRDLVTEQVTLCGMEGFREFTAKHYEDLILSWPHPSGCFSATGMANQYFRHRRTSVATDFGCDSHATGLAAAALSLMIRENLENYSAGSLVARTTSGLNKSFNFT